MFLILLLLSTTSAAYESYMQLERYDKFPQFVEASKFRYNIGNVKEAIFRKMISDVIFDRLTKIMYDIQVRSPVNENIDILNKDCRECVISTSIIHGGGGIGTILNYRSLKKIHSELLERGITFACIMDYQDTTVPFTEMDPFGSMPITVRLQYTNITTSPESR